MRAIVALPASQQAAANARWPAITGNPADAMTFTVGLSPDGRLPVTCYWACGEFSAALLAEVDAHAADGWRRWDCEMVDSEDVLVELGVRAMRPPWEAP